MTDKDRLDASLQRAAGASTASSRASAPTVPSSPTTSAGSRSAPATSRAAPCSSRGSDKIRGGARKTNAEISRIQPHQGRRHRRHPDHPRHRRRAAAGAVVAVGHLPAGIRRCSPRRAASPPATTSRCRESRSARSRRSNSTTATRSSVSPSTASTRSARKPPRTSAPERCSASGCWPWIPRALARSTPVQIIPTTRTSSPYSLTDAVGDLTANTAATDTGSLNQSLDTLADDARPDRSATRPDVRRPDADCPSRSTIATRAWPSCSRPLGM